ncbi:NUDIX domain-containing protein [Aureimonas phyllosphaerae]|uniref:8-oxo-dGTP pyrophosphatase MutT (NUDIX family) n=1 Tax=Aureimonas phyllosphaerae TaxID=1166078 RepID=A0A7W6BNU8_9HYPH|nr:NUDIX domain-containing protein [Aureimonas phyllosphaerae]MBB3935346.1 8-oxo-dGTP pyrophosphatase MutT (NUDIX family) [Aureimonas phyllosphaerae]MBB3959354.1 8-oxo-dGTP pyrophosphatase MutT (NUDIX family) [Aureimonas phyllosphaerae]SFF04231.1 hypothetical protein SAMN05216566_10264 [Aureimonas phyllosphaerae]
MSDPARRVRPKDAASLLVYDSVKGEIRFLMGVRAASHLFMPGHLVFPGGRLEASDMALARHLAVDAAVATRLMAGSPKPRITCHAAALALAAIRETQEETGLLVAELGRPLAMPAGWEPFAAAGAVPTPRALMPLARAITPPGLPRRFDARFFLVSADRLLDRRLPARPPTDEFDTVIWVGPEQLKNFRVAEITARVLDAAFRRLEAGTQDDPWAPIPFFRRRRGEHTVEYL